ncbi:MAG: undecaprenyl/decaprenyl-phosphate alpha-N-acetylglucosaminyl 1-phosphate transferase, partial [Actinobacteria bacterium]|nr:undecaprenyl/decaprenyl-phosphate alpha-N-acetylglucosaminyl 1-phosphate transferase [Actinomycetota bacterium]
MLDHLVVFLVALGTTVVATPPVRALARRLGAVDEPEERRVHAAPTPTLGGLGLLAGVLAAIGAGALLPGFDEVFATTSEPEAIVLAAVVIAGVGAVDDLRGMSAPVKLAGQLLAAGMLVLFGVSMLFIWIPGNPGSIVSLTPDLGALLTIAAIVAMINAVNLVDGLDGLAAGIVAIASVALFCYVQYSGHSTVSLTTSAPLLLPALAGACVGFLFYNFNPASIFMGDTGAMLLGLLLGAAGVSAVGGTVS